MHRLENLWLSATASAVNDNLDTVAEYLMQRRETAYCQTPTYQLTIITVS